MTPMRSKRLSLAVGPARPEPPYLPRVKEDEVANRAGSEMSGRVDEHQGFMVGSPRNYSLFITTCSRGGLIIKETPRCSTYY
jgi:hypothetical protein